MKFVAIEDIAAPASHVWTRITDFDRFEKRIAGKAGRVERIPSGPVQQGTTWTGRANFNGKMRDAKVALQKLDPERAMVLSGGTEGMEITIDIELDALSATSSRLTVTTEAKARTLAARLLLQSARLARQTLAKRYKGRVAAFAEEIERSA